MIFFFSLFLPFLVVAKAADLGHGGPGAVPIHHAELLSQRQRADPDLRHHLRGVLPLPARVAAGDRAVCQQQGHHCARG